MKNLEQVRETLKGMLQQFDIIGADYQTDVYAYYDKETDVVKLDTFVNVGGNSWLNDDHITIYRDKPHYEKIRDYFYTEISELAELAGMDKETFIKAVAKKYDTDIDDVDYYDCRRFAEEYYSEKIDEEIAWYIEHESDYSNTIDECIELLEEAIFKKYGN